MIFARRAYNRVQSGHTALVTVPCRIVCVALLLTLMAVSFCVAVLALPRHAVGSDGTDQETRDPVRNTGWRLRIKDAAVVQGDHVLLGEIADPIGPIEPAVWAQLAKAELWPSPAKGRPMNMTRPRIQQAMAYYAGELSSFCSYPASMVVQRGGNVLTTEELQQIVAKSLTPLIRAMPGEASLQDFRLPSAVLLSEEEQSVELEGPVDLAPGRMSLRLAVKDIEGRIVKRLTGTVFVDVWVEVPCAAVPLNKDEVLEPNRVTFARKNLAHIKGTVWDGRGGPWRMQRPIALGQPIMQTDVAIIPTVRKGAAVTMIFEGRNVTVSIPGEALSDGARGETISVRNLQSKKQLRATVRDGQTVIVR